MPSGTRSRKSRGRAKQHNVVPKVITKTSAQFEPPSLNLDDLLPSFSLSSSQSILFPLDIRRSSQINAPSAPLIFSGVYTILYTTSSPFTSSINTITQTSTPFPNLGFCALTPRLSDHKLFLSIPLSFSHKDSHNGLLQVFFGISCCPNLVIFSSPSDVDLWLRLVVLAIGLEIDGLRSNSSRRLCVTFVVDCHDPNHESIVEAHRHLFDVFFYYPNSFFEMMISLHLNSMSSPKFTFSGFISHQKNILPQIFKIFNSYSKYCRRVFS
ncbi:hypothetical protein RCL1_006127 [Eukaryota sp. TZLM3-RCL]